MAVGDAPASAATSGGGGGGEATGKTIAETAAEWDKISKSWDTGFLGSITGRFNRAALDVIADAAADKLPPQSRKCDVLDFGAGTGQLTLALAARATSVTAVDVAPAMIAALDAKLAAGEASNVTTYCGDIAAAEGADTFRPDSFDLVVSGSVLTFVPDLPATLRKLSQLMRPDAMAVHFVWEYKGKTPAPRPVRRTEELHYQDGISEAQLQAEVEAAGLEVVDTGYIAVPVIPCCPCCCAMKWCYVVCKKRAS